MIIKLFNQAMQIIFIGVVTVVLIVGLAFLFARRILPPSTAQSNLTETPILQNRSTITEAPPSSGVGETSSPLATPFSPPTSPLPTPTPLPPAGSLPFETIDKYDFSLYENPTPALILVAAPHDTDILAPYVPSTTVEMIAEIDFEHYIVVGVFQGLQLSGPAGVTVQKIVLKNHIVEIDAAFVEPEGVAQQAIMSAYQIIKVQKPDLAADRNISFNLVANGDVVLQQEYTFP